MLRWYFSRFPHFYSEWLWLYCGDSQWPQSTWIGSMYCIIVKRPLPSMSFVVTTHFFTISIKRFITILLWLSTCQFGKIKCDCDHFFPNGLGKVFKIEDGPQLEPSLRKGRAQVLAIYNPKFSFSFLNCKLGPKFEFRNLNVNLRKLDLPWFIIYLKI